MVWGTISGPLVGLGGAEGVDDFCDERVPGWLFGLRVFEADGGEDAALEDALLVDDVAAVEAGEDVPGGLDDFVGGLEWRLDVRLVGFGDGLVQRVVAGPDRQFPFALLCIELLAVAVLGFALRFEEILWVGHGEAEALVEVGLRLLGLG